MQNFEFKIIGNHEDPKGNPLPKLRLTQRSMWTEKAARYFEWGDYVRLCFIDSYPSYVGKPFKKGVVARMDLMIYWGKENHGDPEGIFGSIADALFEDDKHLDGSFTTVHLEKNSKERPRVEVKITTVV